MIKKGILSLLIITLTIPLFLTINHPHIVLLNNTSTTLTEHEIKAEFDRIAETPYDDKSYNCVNKSYDFAKFLKKNNQTGIYLARTQYKTGEYSHIFVVWNDKAYDPTSVPPVYAVEKYKFFRQLNSEGWGFISLTQY